MTESGVQAAVPLVAREREVGLRAGALGHPGHHDLAVGAQGDGVRRVVSAGEVGDHDAAVAEPGVEAAVAAIADQGEVDAARGSPRLPHDHDLAVRLKSDAGGLVELARDVGGHRAAFAEGRIETPGPGRSPSGLVKRHRLPAGHRHRLKKGPSGPRSPLAMLSL